MTRHSLTTYGPGVTISERVFVLCSSPTIGWMPEDGELQ